MIDPKNLLSSLDSGGLVGKMLGGMATKNFAAGLLTGGVASSMLGGKDTLENMAKVGGLALLGTLAYKAYGNYQQQKASGGNASIAGAVSESAQGMVAQGKGLLSGLLNSGAPQAAAPQALPAPATLSPELSLAIIRAMIGAAKADGNLDAAESDKIMGQMDAVGATAQEKMLIMQEISTPKDVSEIARAATTPQDAAQIYLAAVLVCDSQCAAEQLYLSTLAGALKLEPEFTQGLQKELISLNANKAA